jgi:hypothetical protein
MVNYAIVTQIAVFAIRNAKLITQRPLRPLIFWPS